MRKFSFAVTAAVAVFISFYSCEKETIKEETIIQEQSAPQETNTMILRGTSTPCPLSNITTTDYYYLSGVLAGSGGTGLGTSGVLDTKLNCNGTSPGPCSVTAQNLYIGSFSNDISEGNHVLSDGVMTIAEQQWMVTNAQTICANHLNANFPTYAIKQYDISYTFALCGPDCISIVFFANYTASKKCL